MTVPFTSAQNTSWKSGLPQSAVIASHGRHRGDPPDLDPKPVARRGPEPVDLDVGMGVGHEHAPERDAGIGPGGELEAPHRALELERVALVDAETLRLVG